jgi:hypothetical protein
MISKIDIIKTLKGKKVVDIGGAGYGNEGIRRDEMLKSAWAGAERTIIDIDSSADIVVDLNKIPLPSLNKIFDVAVAFDVLEHCKNPALILEWIPAREVWINVPVASSFNCQRIERICHKTIPGFKHLYTFGKQHIVNLLKETGWNIIEVVYTFETQSWKGNIFKAFASICPYLSAMGIAVHGVRKDGYENIPS